MPPDPIADFLDAMDTKSFAQEVAQNVPTLVHIGVFAGCGIDSGTYWEVIRSADCSHENGARDLVVLANMGGWLVGNQMFWNAPEDD